MPPSILSSFPLIFPEAEAMAKVSEVPCTTYFMLKCTMSVRLKEAGAWHPGICSSPRIILALKLILTCIWVLLPTGSNKMEGEIERFVKLLIFSTCCHIQCCAISKRGWKGCRWDLGGLAHNPFHSEQKGARFVWC